MSGKTPGYRGNLRVHGADITATAMLLRTFYAQLAFQDRDLTLTTAAP